MEILRILTYLAKKGALCRPIAITTSNLGNELGIAQQSISRWLMNTEQRGFMERKKGIRGYLVQITPKGRKYMEDIRKQLDEALYEARKIIIKGHVFDGMGEGRYYMSLHGYRDAIKKQLGFDPYHGTLNIKLKTLDECKYKEKLYGMKGIIIPGFSGNERSFGSLKCFRCEISGHDAAVILPERSHYGSDILEVISGIHLRKALGLKTGDYLKVEVFSNE
ncbi:MAG: CTP-dependent riboflavin kinase [Candidatus Aenigmarchaeota archaeon]|nr:CTP-dependent riboflavin kinase [Candidatus Aenigmarchaeota archaeon]